ncbi:zinc finger protein [Capsaspora owczarzaki ATCC 30864]|uniref:Zinc finger protein n=1 Tax=Capsaspora owczarzaki (strain ATCC 30864) TaxID=595528 RepID=A0A0D2U3A9_CAPO3|nr:zinc finger protein [Capsaspora owczarzaki ATCC 30864]KJE89661.1 zinc finger protein [Capsaspora owczarzaki ATCC 30864]|eukprot:XP_004365967.2 zinc finger protein [Capsaspora owczarzaki ATCC 30864]
MASTVTSAAAAAAAAAVPSTTYTCITCRVAFRTADAQRDHYKADWHRYNLKRKVAEMPPLSAEQFGERVMSQNATAAATAQRAASTQQFNCDVCSKHFASQHTYATHIQSNKHKDAAAAAEARAASGEQPQAAAAASERKHNTQQHHKKDDGVARRKAEQPTAPTDAAASTSTTATATSNAEAAAAPENAKPTTEAATETAEDDEEEDLEAEYLARAVELSEEDCLFCSRKSASFEANMEHMAYDHSFFIPDMQYLVDLRGLIKYLGEKIGTGNICLYCNGKGRSFRSIGAVRKHMISKGHCMLKDDEELEFADYYDFRSTYPDFDPNNPDANADEEVDEQRLIALGTAVISEDDMELTLASGAKLGHRALRRYYKQHFSWQDSRDAETIGRLAANYRMLGYHDSSILHNGKTRAQLHQDKRIQQAQAQQSMKVGIKYNKIHTIVPQVMY